MHKNKFLLAVLIVLVACFSASLSKAQTKIIVDQKDSDPYVHDTYQMFVDFEIQSIQKIEYEKELKPLKGYLDEDKTSIVLDNYDGKSRVKVTCKDIFGETHEIIKSRCFIDPYETL